MTDREYAAVVAEMLLSEWGLHEKERPYLSLHLINGERLVAKLVNADWDVTMLRATNGDQFAMPTRAICYYRWVEDPDRPPITYVCPHCRGQFEVSAHKRTED